MLIPLLESGKVVDGVDLSGPMLEICRTNLSLRGLTAELYQQDLAALSLPHRYDAIVMPTGSFGLLPRDKAREALVRFRKHLNPGGLLIVDIEIPVLGNEGEPGVSSVSLGSGRQVILTGSGGAFDEQEQTTTYTNKYELVDAGEVLQAQTAQMVMHWYSFDDVEGLLSRCGFEEITREVGYGTDSQAVATFVAKVGSEK